MVTHGGLTPAAKISSGFPLARQASIYSLTLDEFQNSLGEPGKNFGSMNMDEFMKNIWTAEESQAMALAVGASEFGNLASQQGGIQRQGSLTLPRTLSRKTVDDVWRDIHKDGSNNTGEDNRNDGGTQVENNNGNEDNNNGNNNNNINGSTHHVRQPTFGEMTLEDFLVKAGVVREEPERGTNGQVFDLGVGNSLGLGIGHRNNGEIQKAGGPPPAQPMPISGLSLSPIHVDNTVNLDPYKQHQQADWITNHYRSTLSQQQQQPQFLHGDMYKRGGGALGLGNGGLGGFCHSPLALGGGSPASPLSSDGVGPSHVDNSSISPVPYGLDGAMRGRKRGYDGPVEKVVERRQRRMIKNRESAARSRARKQAYTVELEAEVNQLKEENSKLRKQQEEMAERRKKQILEVMAPRTKPRVLRRTKTGPW